MKHFFQVKLLILAGMLFAQIAQAQSILYVKSGALGANNGNSWADAYNNLDAALTAATAGAQIWVASGVYKPNTSVTPNKSFQLASGVSMYGGFAGNETALNQRNLTTNLSILSGDINGDDITDSLSLNKSDNSWHVLVVYETSPSLRSVVDGFVIRNGATKTASADPDLTKRGGGVLATAKLTIRNCLFAQNNAVSGGGMAALDASSAGLIVENCIFEKNTASSQTAGLYLRSSNDAQVKNCIFRNNTTTRGVLYPQTCKGVVIDSCLFENNKTPAMQFGAGMFTWQSSFILKNSIFRGNSASTASGMYNDGRENGNAFTIENCLFENNTSAGYGGGIYNWQANCTLKNCTFRGNNASNAAGVYNDGRDNISTVLLENCNFENNTATDYGGSAVFNSRAKGDIKNCHFSGNVAPSSAASMYNGDSKMNIINCLFEKESANFGAALANFGSASDVLIDGCTFDQNKVNTSGGAMINGFIAKVKVKNSTFTNNLAKFGGAIFCQNDSTSLNVEGSFFRENNADNIGGAINISAGISAQISTSTFAANSANFGAAIDISEDSLDLAELQVERCIFKDNLTFKQAGGININNANVSVVNSLFAGNSNFGDGAGGAISNNASGDKNSDLEVTNCTFVDNSAVIGSGIAQFTGDNGTAELHLQNNIFFNLGNNYEIESGTPTVKSHGGNFVTDNTLDANLLAGLDIKDADPLFTDPGNYNYTLQAGSPCINKGVATDAPSVDLNGFPRVGLPDIGSYEYGTSGTHSVLKKMDLSLSPNPATDWVRAQIDQEWNGRALLRIADQEGRTVQSQVVEKNSNPLYLNLDVHNLPSGAYVVYLRLGNSLMVGRFVK